MSEERRTKTLFKYFAHGLLFSLLYILLVFFVSIAVPFLYSIGSLIGIVLGIALLCLLLGYANSTIVDRLWDLPLDTSWFALLLHGVLLFIVLLIVEILIVWLPERLMPGLVTAIVTFIIVCFVNGKAAKTIAKKFPPEKI